MTIGIIGLGLMGSSMALALQKCSFGSYFIGHDVKQEHETLACSLNIVNEIDTLENLSKKATIIILAIPTHHIEELLPQVLDYLSPQAYVLDLGSTKVNIAQAVAQHPKRAQYIATHPMAGTENSGPEAAFATLFINKVAVICDSEKSNPEGLALVKRMYANLWMRLIEMSAEDHDRHIAYVSHLSHISSFALGHTVLEIEKNEKNIFDMAGSGFASTVRLAKSSPEMWTPIFEKNKENVLFALNAYIKNLETFKTLLENDNFDALKYYMKKTNEIRKVLNGIST